MVINYFTTRFRFIPYFYCPSQVVLPILHALQQPQRRDLLLDRPRANHAIERGGNSRTNTMMKLGDGERKSKLQAVSTVPHNSYDRNHNSATHAAAPPPSPKSSPVHRTFRLCSLVAAKQVQLLCLYDARLIT